MNYPDFFNKIETIKVQDQLSAFLGTFENGIIEFTYLDVVKSQGIVVLQLQVLIYVR